MREPLISRRFSSGTDTCYKFSTVRLPFICHAYLCPIFIFSGGFYEKDRLQTEAKASGVYEMYYIELATGLRRGELLGLKWSDIDWKNGIIKVKRQVARVDGKVTEAPLKTKNSYRTVTISPQAVEVLKQQKAKTKDEFVFPSPNGGTISPDSVNNMLKRVLERAGIPKVRFHDLRHTFATVALQNGVDIKTVSGMLGHFSAGFTLDTYAHVTTAAQKEAAQTIGNALSL